MLKSEKYEYGSMWTANGFWNRVSHMSDDPKIKLFVLWPLAGMGAMFMLMFTLSGGFLFTMGKRHYRKQQAEMWRHREALEAMKSKK